MNDLAICFDTELFFHMVNTEKLTSYPVRKLFLTKNAYASKIVSNNPLIKT